MSLSQARLVSRPGMSKRSPASRSPPQGYRWPDWTPGRSRCKSPDWVDHLVTFIACEFVTASRITEILGCSSWRFYGLHRRNPAATPDPHSFAALRYHESIPSFDCTDGFPD